MPKAQQKPEQRGIQSIEKGLQILRTLAQHPSAMPLSQLAASEGLPASIVHRYMVSFIRQGFVEQIEDGRYDLGPSALTIGLAKLARLDAFRTGLSYLDRLHSETGETVLLVAWNGYVPVVIRWIEADRPINVYVRPGSVLPLLGSASGRVFSAFLSTRLAEHAITREFASGVTPTYEGRKLSKSNFLEMLETVRRDGVACLKGDFTPGIDAASAPVFDHQGRIQFALTVLVPAGVVDLGPRSQRAGILRQVAAECSRALGHRSSRS